MGALGLARALLRTSRLMGREVRCRATLGDRSGEGKALLETEEIVFRGDAKAMRYKVPLKSLTKIVVVGDRLVLDGPKIKAVLELGAKEAQKWLERVRKPPSCADKLGVKPGARVALVGTFPDDFVAELMARKVVLATGKPKNDCDLVFFAAEATAALDGLSALKASLAPAGGIWVVRPKGGAPISEHDVRERCRAAGLMDVKVVAFSATHTADKFVIPVADR